MYVTEIKIVLTNEISCDIQTVLYCQGFLETDDDKSSFKSAPIVRLIPCILHAL